MEWTEIEITISSNKLDSTFRTHQLKWHHLKMIPFFVCETFSIYFGLRKVETIYLENSPNSTPHLIFFVWENDINYYPVSSHLQFSRGLFPNELKSIQPKRRRQKKIPTIYYKLNCKVMMRLEKREKNWSASDEFFSIEWE